MGNLTLLAFAAVLLFRFLSSVSGQDLADEYTLAFWKFDEGSGELVEDSSGNGNSGEIGDAEWVEGISGSALFFDGESSRVAVPDSDALHPETGDITIEAWVKIASDPVGWDLQLVEPVRLSSSRMHINGISTVN